VDRYRDANRELWNLWTGLHETSPQYDLRGFKEGKCALKPIELVELGDVRGRSLLHLQCHFGLDTLSWARRGAAVTGVDFSDASVRLARSIAEETAIRAEFLCCDLYDLPRCLDRSFDIVFTSYGVLAWLPDLDGWARVVERFLNPGGIFYIVEIHPFSYVFDNGPGATDLRVTVPYFRSGDPLRFEEQGSYAAPDAPVRSISYEWPYPLGNVLTALIGAGLRIEYVREYPYTVYPALPFLRRGDDGLWRFPDGMIPIPLLFSLKARKEPPRQG